MKAEEKLLDKMSQSPDEPPKVLGDLLESLVGAIYLDSGKSLDCVWTVIYPMMTDFIETYKKSPPINPLRELYELSAEKKWHFDFEEVEDSKDSVIGVKLILKIDGEIRAEGFGRNKRDAKTEAAQKFLQSYNDLSQQDL